MRNYQRNCHVEQAICRELKRRVIAGYWRPGDRLPTELELADEFAASRGTVYKALKTLEKDGLFRAQRGRGRYVCAPTSRPKTHTIGIVISNFEYLQKPTGSKLFSALQSTLAAAGKHFKIIALNPAGGQFRLGLTRDCFELIRPAYFDGLVLITQMVQLETATELAGVCPLVWFHHPSAKPGLAGIRFDFSGGGFAAARHLLALGHRRIGLLNIQETFVSGREQLDGLRLALRDCPEAQLLTAEVATFDPQAAEIRTAAERLLAQKPTAIICGSDDYAPAMWQALQAHGRRVPEEVSLLSWNDTLAATDVPLPLTSIRLDNALAGRLAGEALREMLDNPQLAPATRFVPAELIERASTGPAPCPTRSEPAAHPHLSEIRNA